MKVLFVCTGNTCRSPMAEGIFRKMTEEHGDGRRFYCMSAGLAAVEGEPPTEHAVAVCGEIGVDISKHRSKKISELGNLEAFDVFAVMTSTHAYVLRQAGVPEYKLYVLPGEIPDPFGGDMNTYRICRERIQGALNALYTLIKNRLG
ncbi:MAG: low molecular weight phosphatase family protein [Clostridiales bacterium]|nr:low molecular weight phosphatase family protein [Clostridiales bacterium]